ncbi:MAG: hypothetical protein DSY43_01270 [Gammaproteobacteria bacterium]|nr:MAG: hypothetical protein DSY43_01270 [Gammaproteobacteria bacterium]
MQPYVDKCDIIPAPSTDHSAITLKFKIFESEKGGPSFWKFNNSLVENERYCAELKKQIKDLKTSLNNEGIFNPQSRWELIKYQIRKFSMAFSKELARNRRKAYKYLESEIKIIEDTMGKKHCGPLQESFENFKRIDFHQNGIKILGVYFSYNDKYNYDQNYKRIFTNFQTILSLWKSRNLTLYGKIQVLRSLALPKLLYVCSVLHVPEDFIKIIESTTQDFIWNGKKPKIKHSTLIGDYEEGGLKLPDFQSCLKANRVKWAIKLFQSNEENNNVSSIPSTYLKTIGGFHQINDNFDRKRIPKNIPAFYKSVLTTWSEISENNSNDPNIIYNQYLWNNKYIQIGGHAVFYKDFSVLNINKILDLCDTNGDFTWEHAKGRGLQNNDFLRWAGIIHALPAMWKK